MGKPLFGPLAGCRGAYRTVYRIDEKAGDVYVLDIAAARNLPTAMRAESDSVPHAGGHTAPVVDELQPAALIENGQYEQWLKAWGLAEEAVEKSEVNPPGLPLTNT